MPKAGDAALEEAFITYIPTATILWALVDGAAQEVINIRTQDGTLLDVLA